MKTVAILKKDIKEIEDKITKEWASTNRSKAYKNATKLQKQIHELSSYIPYIETNPKEEFIYKEIERITNRISAFTMQYVPINSFPDPMGLKVEVAGEYKKKQITYHRAKYEKDMGIPKLKQELKTLKYIIS